MVELSPVRFHKLCHLCRQHQTFLYDLDATPQHSLYLPHTTLSWHRYICMSCFVTLEKRYVETLPVEELPLLLNHPWVSIFGQRTYKERLQRLVSP